ncbi:MAG: uracil-DNA glycosylase, partial [Caulobacter sp.]|nr:uracil-DNA glycosylase [Vitreoscilla sp.]
MSWSERQRRMLAAMGVRLWAPAPGATATPTATPAATSGDATSGAESSAAAVAERPASASSPMPVAAPVARAPVSAPVPVPASAPVARPPAPGPARAPPAAAAAAAPAAESDPVLAERATTIATLAWGPLQDAIASCTACGLCESRRQTVFGVGHARADWMIVGEAPGEQEDLQGEPFVGPAGQLLD